MREARRLTPRCTVSGCTKVGTVPLCSGEMHLCGDHFDHWVGFLRKNPLQVEKWSTENFSAWTKHFTSFVAHEVELRNHYTG